jgi:hypothetical protein
MACPMRRLVPVNLADWLDEYRNLPVEEVTRPSSETEDDWKEPDLIASSNGVQDTSPRWLKRAERIGYSRAIVL